MENIEVYIVVKKTCDDHYLFEFQSLSCFLCLYTRIMSSKRET